MSSPSNSNVGVLLLAAGESRRLSVPGRPRKPYQQLSGIPMVAHSLVAFSGLPEVRQIVLVARASDRARAARIARAIARPRALRLRIVAGGRKRSDSVERGLRALSAQIRWVAIHDAARPLVSRGLIRRVLAAARRAGGAIPAMAVPDTLKRVRRGRVQGTVSREGLWAAQTPQIFRRDWLEEAFRRRRRLWTDDACAFETARRPVAVVPGEWSNLKVTTREDLRWAQVFSNKKVFYI